MDHACAKCSGPTEGGAASALGLIGQAIRSPDEPRVVFVVPGTPTSANPLKALKQGLADEPPRRGYLVRGRRCTRCGFVELYATDETAV